MIKYQRDFEGVKRATSSMLLRVSSLIATALTIVATDASAQAFTPSDTGHCICHAPAELLRIEKNRLYLWADLSIRINPDFRIVAEKDNRTTVTCGISKVTDEILISDTLNENAIRMIKSESPLSYHVCLDWKAAAEDNLVIGMPSLFAKQYGDSGSLPRNNLLPIIREYRYYDDLEEAEIDLAVGKIDLLLLPALEVSEEELCQYKNMTAGDFIEWYLLCDLPADNLQSTALNYCLKTEFADTAARPLSLILDPRDIKKIFARNGEKARELLASMRSEERICHLNFPSHRMFPSIAERMQKRVESCGGTLIFDEDSRDIFCHFAFEPRGVEQLPNQCYVWLTELQPLLVESASRRTAWMENLPDSCLVASLYKCSQMLSKRLSENSWLIPLGRMPVVVLMRENVHYLEEVSGRFAIENFYRVSKK